MGELDSLLESDLENRGPQSQTIRAVVKEASQACFEGKGKSYISGKVGWTYFIFFWKLEQGWKDQTYCEAGS